MIKRLVGQYQIIGKAAFSSLAPSLARLGFVMVGLIIGLVWTYQFAPVKFTDAEPVHLSGEYKNQWIKGTAAEYDAFGNAAEAQQRLIKAGVTANTIQQRLLNPLQAIIDQGQAQPSDMVLQQQLQALRALAEQGNVQSQASKQADKTEKSALGGALGPLACVFGTAIIGFILTLVFTFYWAVPVGKWAKGPAGRPTSGVGAPRVGTSSATHLERVAATRAAVDQKTDFAAVGEAPPVSQHVSTYILGDDLYDDSFSIETAAGEFLGECGSGISETIGVGEPKKVTATEVWLFDKNDIRTVTKVLMSRHAYQDQALRTKLAPKGEAVVAEPGTITTLETQTLRVQVKIMDLQYGEGSLPPNSFFERLTVEIASWTKEDAAGNGGGPKPSDPSAAFGDTSELLNY